MLGIRIAAFVLGVVVLFPGLRKMWRGYKALRTIAAVRRWEGQ